MANPLLEVHKYGQSIWYDSIRHGLITSGELAAMVEKDGLLGLTTNPVLFEKTLAGSTDHDQALKALLSQGIDKAQDLLEQLAIQDAQLAADVLYPVYIRTQSRDGYVCLDLPPHLAHDTRAILEEARRLHADVRRDNLLITVPATPAGIPALRQLISEGISVFASLLFDVSSYEQVAAAYLDGLEAYGAKGGDVSKVASVAAFSISRIDTRIDALLEAMLDTTADPARRKLLKGLVGKTALATARIAYAHYRDWIASERWQKLAEQKAMPQRLLWAHTATRNPRNPRTLYAEELIAPDTVLTLSAETLSAFRATGRVGPSLTKNWAESLDAARETLHHLAEAGIDRHEVMRQLLDTGLQQASAAVAGQLAALERKKQRQAAILDTQTLVLGEYAEVFHETLDDWRVGGKVRRLWAGDASLWTGTDEAEGLTWLHAPEVLPEFHEACVRLAEEVRQAGFRHTVVLGMGGSALSPEVLVRTLGRATGFPELIVLDSIIPARIRAVAALLDLTRTLFIVSSKSGGTVETGALLGYFLDRVRQAVGPAQAGKHFVAITDPRTRLHARAKAEHFRHIFFAVPGSAGRFATLSNLGMVPATVLGLDVRSLLHRAGIMAHACASCVPADLNPGVSLGAALGSLALAGRDKVTLALAAPLASLGPWLEQLLSESTGKEGKGIVVIDGEPLAAPGVYGKDRVFVQVQLRGHAEAEQDRALAALEKAGHPVIRIGMGEPADLGQEMFRWQLATAAAGAVLGINPFNQPDVEASKVAARARVSAFETEGKLPEPHAPLAEEGGLTLFADPGNADALLTASGGQRSLEALLRAHLGRLEAGDYFAINAFLVPGGEGEAALASIRQQVRDARKVATMVGYGPRLLHATGQLHKGGPDAGVFVQLTSDDEEDVAVPGQKFSFGVLNRAQALGDFEVLARQRRRLVRLHLGRDISGGLTRLRHLIQAVLR